MKLVFSSVGSPFARKIRIILAELGMTVEEEIRPGLRPVEELQALNPNLSLPVLVDGTDVLFESNLIIAFLLDRHGRNRQDHDLPLAPTMVDPARRWEHEKILATIETFANTLVNVRHFKGEGSTAETSRYMARQEARIASCLDWLEAQATPDGFWPGYFSTMDIALICPLFYGETRRILSWRRHRPKIEALFERSALRPSVTMTAEP